MNKPRLTGIIDRASITELRTLDIQLQDNDKVYVKNVGFFDYEPTSTATDNGVDVVKPDAVLSVNPGRWIKAAGSSAAYKYTKEWHVDPINGLDANTGAEGAPFRTVARAQTAIVGSGDALYLHAGIYTEAVTWNDLNVDIIGASTGGLTRLEGAWTFAHASSSVRVRNVSLVGGFTHSGAGGLYFNECQCPSTITKSGSGYFEAIDCDFGGAGLNVTGAGFVNIIGGKVNLPSVNNAGAVVNLKGCTQVVGALAFSGTLALDGSVAVSVGAASAAIGGQAASTVLIRNSQCYKPDGTLAPITVLGSYSLDDVVFDRAGSNLAGINVGATAHFDGIAAVGQITGSSLSVPWSLNKAFAAEVIVEKDGALYKSNAAIPANTPFALGTAGATWQQVSGAGALSTTSIIPLVYTAGGYVNAQADTVANVADLVVLSDGSRIDSGKVNWAAHGLTVGAYYFLSDVQAGALTMTPPSGIRQRILFVEDVDTVHINVEPAETSGPANPRVYYRTSAAPKPTDATAGDELLVTSTGTSAGTITEQWLYDGVAWVQTSGSTPVSGSVIDNTIGNPALITTVGRYIVPATELTGEFVGKANQYADFDGATFVYTAAAAGESVLITSGTNAGQVWRFSGTAWAVVTQTTGLPIYTWVQANTYKAGDLVLRNDTLYRAVNNIPAGTAFALGSTGAVYTPIDSRDLFNVQAKKNGNQLLVVGDNNITNWTVSRSPFGIFTASTGVYTAPVTGWYVMTFSSRSTAVSWTLGQGEFTPKILVSGTAVSEDYRQPMGGGTYQIGGCVSGVFYMLAGQTVRPQIYHDTPGTKASVAAAFTYLSISRVG